MGNVTPKASLVTQNVTRGGFGTESPADNEEHGLCVSFETFAHLDHIPHTMAMKNTGFCENSSS